MGDGHNLNFRVLNAKYELKRKSRKHYSPGVSTGDGPGFR